MCSILFTTKNIKDLDYVNQRLKLRGPDYTGKFKTNHDGKEFNFIHNLLSITGKFTEQPFVDENIVCLYNGEIYNYSDFGDYKSDGCCLIPLYKEYGVDFIKKLDGEFVILLADLNKNILLLSTDIFKTKPVYVAIDENDIGISSYMSPLQRLNYKNIFKSEANKTYIFDLKTMSLKDENPVYEFILNQYKDSFDDWNQALQNSIKKRINNIREHLFLGLSSGYDSGVIACELFNNKVEYKVYSVCGKENFDIVKRRHDLISKYAETEFLDIVNHRDESQKFIIDNTDEYRFEIYTSHGYHEPYMTNLLTNDYGAIGLSYICKNAKKDNRKIYLSGQGADEIFADYGHAGVRKAGHSSFFGVFPNDLSTMFPWPNFYESSQEAFLTKEEYVAGAYGIETRYPFLDKDVVQEFLYLQPKLKNKYYKSVLHNYLVENKFPFELDIKRGFSV
tara:strand:- start:408 stop:1754 length:1347 start_codon:yes stop_codon:yes gene_type:complete